MGDFTFGGIDSDSLNLYLKSHNIGILPDTIDLFIENDSLDGTDDQGTLYDARSFNLDCILICDTLEDQYNKLKAIHNLFFTNTPKPLILEEEPDKFLNCQLNGAINIANTGLYTELSIPLIAPDPFWYSVEEHISSSNQIYNNGNYYTPFIMTLQGPVSSTPVKIYINDEIMQYDIALSSVDTLYIDTNKEIVLFNGFNAAKHFNNIFPKLRPGANSIYTIHGSISIKWRDCWL